MPGLDVGIDAGVDLVTECGLQIGVRGQVMTRSLLKTGRADQVGVTAVVTILRGK